MADAVCTQVNHQPVEDTCQLEVGITDHEILHYHALHKLKGCFNPDVDIPLAVNVLLTQMLYSLLADQLQVTIGSIDIRLYINNHVDASLKLKCCKNVVLM